MFRTFAYSDPYNIGGQRNQKNTFVADYNCGGFALGLFSWYCPHDKSSDNRSNYRFKTTEQAVAKTFTAVQYMLNDLPNVRVIGSLYELKHYEYAVAFRISADDDFHFVKRLGNGHWVHKRGGTPIRSMLQADVFSECWFDRYTGPLVLLAVGK